MSIFPTHFSPDHKLCYLNVRQKFVHFSFAKFIQCIRWYDILKDHAFKRCNIWDAKTGGLTMNAR